MTTRKQSADPSKIKVTSIRPSVQSVQRVGPTHAQGLQNLVGIYANVREGEPCNECGWSSKWVVAKLQSGAPRPGMAELMR